MRDGERVVGNVGLRKAMLKLRMVGEEKDGMRGGEKIKPEAECAPEKWLS